MAHSGYARLDEQLPSKNVHSAEHSRVVELGVSVIVDQIMDVDERFKYDFNCYLRWDASHRALHLAQ